jgi:hypothetical protein
MGHAHILWLQRIGGRRRAIAAPQRQGQPGDKPGHDGRGKNRCLSIFMDFVEKRPNKRRSAVAASRAAGW